MNLTETQIDNIVMDNFGRDQSLYKLIENAYKNGIFKEYEIPLIGYVDANDKIGFHQVDKIVKYYKDTSNVDQSNLKIALIDPNQILQLPIEELSLNEGWYEYESNDEFNPLNSGFNDFKKYLKTMYDIEELKVQSSVGIIKIDFNELKEYFIEICKDNDFINDVIVPDTELLLHNTSEEVINKIIHSIFKEVIQSIYDQYNQESYIKLKDVVLKYLKSKKVTLDEIKEQDLMMNNVINEYKIPIQMTSQKEFYSKTSMIQNLFRVTEEYLDEYYDLYTEDLMFNDFCKIVNI